MNRLKINELESWYKSPRRKPLVVWGARQVGKSYLVVELFAKKHFEEYVYIDLQKDNQALQFFKTTSAPSAYLSYIETRYGKQIGEKCPLIFDEVQNCHQVLTSLKYFNQDYPGLPVIATGSLVRLSINQTSKQAEDNFLFPVGKIDSISLYPLTFEEYIMNVNPVLYGKVKEAYINKTPMLQYEHELAMDILHQYLAIGGMPEALDVFIQTGSYVEASNVVRNIYSNYLADMATFNTSSETILKTRNLYKNIFSQLDKENKNFKVSQVEKGKSNRDYFNAYQWLELARITYRNRHKTGKVTVPLCEDLDSGLFRLYLSDVGMFALQSGVNQSDFYVKDQRNTLSGVFYENYVADELVSKGIELFYWTGKQRHEFEFIVQSGGKIIPIDVKKSKGDLNSLDEFRSVNPSSMAVKVHSGNFGYNQEKNILSIPHYAVFMLAEDISLENI